MGPNTTLDNIISISQNGVDARNATGSQLLFSAHDPFAKLDKSKTTSFQNIRLLFNHEPPDPDGTVNLGPLTTLIMPPIPHGYDYVPSTWFLLQIISGGPIRYQQESAEVLLVDNSFYTAAVFRATADKDNVYFYIDKYYDAGGHGSTAKILGYTLLIRLYIFAGDLSGTVAGS